MIGKGKTERERKEGRKYQRTHHKFYDFRIKHTRMKSLLRHMLTLFMNMSQI